jgi:hypothetical protein
VGGLTGGPAPRGGVMVCAADATPRGDRLASGLSHGLVNRLPDFVSALDFHTRLVRRESVFVFSVPGSTCFHILVVPHGLA